MITSLDTTITIKGMSGSNYIFNVYGFKSYSDLINTFTNTPALFAFTKRYSNGHAFEHDLIYVGETKDLSTSFNQSHNYNRFLRNDANCICIHSFYGSASERTAAETDIINACGLQKV